MTPSVLVIDDDRASTRLVEAVGRLVGVDIVSLHSAAEAMARAGRAGFALGLFDLQLPGCTGLELLRLMRGSAAGAPARCILLTADVTATDEAFVAPDRFDELWLKPIETARLAATLQGLLGG